MVLKKIPSALSHVLVMVVILISFVIFNADSLAQAGSDIAGMFGAGSVSFVTEETLYYLRSYAVIIVLGLIGSTPAATRIAERLRAGNTTSKIMKFAEPVVLIALLLVCTAFLVDGSFNPFLYFRF